MGLGRHTTGCGFPSKDTASCSLILEVLLCLPGIWYNVGRTRVILLTATGGFLMKFTIDLHVHTKYSGDNDADPDAVIVRAIERGLHGVAFTEHYFFEA